METKLDDSSYPLEPMKLWAAPETQAVLFHPTKLKVVTTGRSAKNNIDRVGAGLGSDETGLMVDAPSKLDIILESI